MLEKKDNPMSEESRGEARVILYYDTVYSFLADKIVR